MSEELYLKQIQAIEALFVSHPDYFDTMFPNQRVLIEKWWLPDKSIISDYGKYLKQLQSVNPTEEDRALKALKLFLNRWVKHPENLLP